MSKREYYGGSEWRNRKDRVQRDCNKRADIGEIGQSTESQLQRDRGTIEKGQISEGDDGGTEYR